MEVKVDTSGKIVLPKALREAAHLGPGTVAEARVVTEGLLLVPKGRPKRQDTFLGYLEEFRAHDKGRKLSKEQVLDACESALEDLVE